MVTSAINRKNTPASKPQTSEPPQTSIALRCAPSNPPASHHAIAVCRAPRAHGTWVTWITNTSKAHQKGTQMSSTPVHGNMPTHNAQWHTHTHTHTRMFCAHLSGNMIRNTTHTYEYKGALLTHDRTRHRPPKTEDLRSLCLD